MSSSFWTALSSAGMIEISGGSHRMMRSTITGVEIPADVYNDAYVEYCRDMGIKNFRWEVYDKWFHDMYLIDVNPFQGNEFIDILG